MNNYFAQGINRLTITVFLIKVLFKNSQGFINQFQKFFIWFSYGALMLNSGWRWTLSVGMEYDGSECEGEHIWGKSKYRYSTGGTQRERHRGLLLNAVQKIMFLQFQLLNCRNKIKLTKQKSDETQPWCKIWNRTLSSSKDAWRFDCDLGVRRFLILI